MIIEEELKFDTISSTHYNEYPIVFVHSVAFEMIDIGLKADIVTSIASSVLVVTLP